LRRAISVGARCACPNREGPIATRPEFGLSFVELIAGNAEFPRDLGGRALAGIEQLHRLSFKLRRELSSFCHLTPPWGRIGPPFEVSVKPGPPQTDPAGIHD